MTVPDCVPYFVRQIAGKFFERDYSIVWVRGAGFHTEPPRGVVSTGLTADFVVASLVPDVLILHEGVDQLIIVRAPEIDIGGVGDEPY